MARSCRIRPPARDLVALATQLDAVAEEVGWGAPPLLIGLTDDGVSPADPPISPGDPPGDVSAAAGPDPADLVASLVGFVAPDDWRAMAVVVQGRSWLLDDVGADPRPVRLTHVVDRSGEVATVLRHAGDPPTVRQEPGAGRLVDVCRRALGLSTPPPPEDSTLLWALQWMDGLVVRVARGERIRGLVAAARAHPAVELVAEHDPDLVDEAIARLVRLGTLMGAQRPWPKLHRAAASGEWSVEGLAPEGAAWMDAGMFARWVLGEYPDLDEYLAELGELVPEAVVDGVRAVLEQWDLLR
jgi:hypothetical protein